VQQTDTDLKEYIRTRAYALGFSFLGFAQAEKLTHHEKPLRSWLEAGMHGEMGYMANHLDIRLDPRLLHPDTRTIISLAYNYFPETKQSKDSYQVAKYAYGKDYHEILKPKLHTLLNDISSRVPCSGRVFTDSAPILEREWARRAGLGWIGKNSLLIHPKQGSFFFLAEIIIDIAIEADEPFSKNMCGNCTRCMDACPTKAIVSPGIVDGSKCLSYLTIELRGEFDNEIPSDFSNRIFGCDICQDVCPWNSKSIPHTDVDFTPHPRLLTLSKKDWDELSEDDYKAIFRKSAVKRAKYEGLKRNITRAGNKRV